MFRYDMYMTFMKDDGNCICITIIHTSMKLYIYGGPTMKNIKHVAIAGAGTSLPVGDSRDAKGPFGLLKKCKEEGRLGIKSGAGFYDYSDGKDIEAIKHRDEMLLKLSKCLFEDK